MFPEIRGLFFGYTEDGRAVFDYTAYVEANELQTDYKSFMRLNKHFIEPLAEEEELSTSQLFFQNTDGHILIDGKLAVICLMFSDPKLLIYFTGILEKAMTDGIAYCHSYLYALASEMPLEMLKDIIKESEDDTDGNKQ